MKKEITATQPTNAVPQQVSGTFVSLYEADKKRLYGYIYMHVMDYAIADDIFQDTSIILWQEFHKFKLGTNFAVWANAVAFNRIRSHRRSHKKYALGLSEDLLVHFSETIAIAEHNTNKQPRKWRYLQQCSNLLPSSLRKIYQAFYVDEQQAQDIANTTGRSIHAIRKSVHKLRKTLFDCVDQKLNEAAK